MSKVILITGASSGIGKITAGHLSSKGFKVYGTSRNPKPTKSDNFTLIKLDLHDKVSIEKAIELIKSKSNEVWPSFYNESDW